VIRQMADPTPDLCRECGDEAAVTLMGARFCWAHAQAVEEDFARHNLYLATYPLTAPSAITTESI